MIKFARLIVFGLLVSGLTGCTGDILRPDGFIDAPAQQKPVQRSTYYEAIHQYSSSYAQDKNNLTALLGLARNLRFSGQEKRALEQLESAKKRFGTRSIFLTELGKAHLAVGNIRTARKILENVTERNNNSWQAYSALGISYDFLKDYSKAASSYNKALAICPDSASILNNTAISTALTGDIGTAQYLLARASNLRPHSARIKNNISLFKNLAARCFDCDAKKMQRIVGRTITTQDWGHGDLACSNMPDEIIETLSHADFIDMKVEFEFDKAVLLPEARETLDGLGLALISEALEGLVFSLEGHTDATGTEEYNQTLSERRADAVKDYLVNMLGLDEARLDSTGFGESRLLDTKNPDSSVNRRVRVTRIK